MINIWKEMIYSWKKTVVFNILLIILFTLLFWLFTTVISYYVDLPTWINDESIKNGYQYYTMGYYGWDISESEDDTTISFDTVNIEKAKLVLHEIQKNKDYQYMAIENRTFAIEYDDIKERIGDHDFINFMTGSLYPGYYSDFPEQYLPELIEPHQEGAIIGRAASPQCYRINESFMNHFSLEAVEGHLFAPEDFVFHKGQKEIPILLGGEYADYYKIGDTFKMDLCNLLVDAKVIGILKKNCIVSTDQMIEINGHSLTLDYSMIIPFFNDIKKVAESDDDLWFELLNYEAYLQGFVVMNGDMPRSEVIRIQRKITQTFVKNGLKPVNFSGVPYGMGLFQKETSQTMSILFGLVVVMGIFGILSSCLCLLTKINRNIRRYAIQLMNGKSLVSIMISFVIEILSIIILSIIFSVYIMFDQISSNMDFLFVILGSGTFVAVVVLCVIFYKLQGQNIEELIRRKE